MGVAFNSCLLNFYRRWACCVCLLTPLLWRWGQGSPVYLMPPTQCWSNDAAASHICHAGLCPCSGADSIGWHSDSEPLYGREPTIATVSLGDPREFLLRRNADHSERYRFRLGGGALLVMSGPVQEQVGAAGGH